MRSPKASFDYIIIGAGSAGCVLANKLGADPSKSILVLEAGPPDRDLMIHMPAGVYSAYKNPKINWNYLTEDEPHAFDRNVEMPRGKVVGGSSSINSMVYMRGHPLDYDRWASECGLKNWRFADCLPYFKAGETSDRGADEWRGGEGLLGVTKGSFDNPLYDAFLDAGEQAGQGRSEDLNGYQPEGVSRFDATRWNGRRCSAALAYLGPAIRRGNITLITRALVHKVNIVGNRTKGVTFMQNGVVRTCEAEAEVLLCGGAINSPQTLMLSGIGPADHLKKFDIESRIHLKGVGQNLQDHATVVLQNMSTKSFPIHKVDHPLRKFAAGARWVFLRDGIVASNIWEAGGMVYGNHSFDQPNLQYHFGPIGFEFANGKMKLRQAFSMHIDQLRPRSRGSVSLQSKNPSDKPLMLFNYFAKNEDLEELAEGIHKARELIAQPAFDEFRGVEIDPGPDVKTDDDIRKWIRANSATDYHPSGTCRMGHGLDAVVDEEFRVHGVEGLRVVDASVIPQIISGNLNAPVQMMAARAADYITGTAQLAPQFANFHFMKK